MKDAVFLWELEKMDPAIGRCVVHLVALSGPAVVHLGTAEVKGQCSFALGRSVGLTQR